MKSRTLTCITAMTLLAALPAPLALVAQEQQQSNQQPRYRLVDLGTFGGPSSYLSTTNGVTSPGAVNQVLNSRGAVAGWGDTSTPDPYAPYCFNPFPPDCFLPHAFQWQKGVLTDLGE